MRHFFTRFIHTYWLWNHLNLPTFFYSKNLRRRGHLAWSVFTLLSSQNGKKEIERSRVHAERIELGRKSSAHLDNSYLDRFFFETLFKTTFHIYINTFKMHVTTQKSIERMLIQMYCVWGILCVLCLSSAIRTYGFFLLRCIYSISLSKSIRILLFSPFEEIAHLAMQW